MRLAFINFYSGFAERGGETFVDSLATTLSKKNDVFVFQSGRSTNKPYREITTPIKFNPEHPHANLPVNHILKRLFLDYFSLKVLVFTLKIIPLLIKINPDFIYPLNSGWQIFILTLVARIFGMKVIVGGHSGPGWNDRVNLLFHPDIFVALTKTQAEWAKKATIWNNQKIVVVPNGVNLNVFSPKGERRALDLEKPIVLAVGAASKSKRIKETIKAVANIKKASLLVCGTGPDEKQEDELAKKLLNKRFLRLNVSHSDMPSIYRSADVFTLCSESSEAFGIVYLEALASGLPCVVTDDPSRREILGDIGIYVKNPQDSEEYAQKIKEALKIGKSNKFIERAKIFSWDKISKDNEKLITDSLAKED